MSVAKASSHSAMNSLQKLGCVFALLVLLPAATRLVGQDAGSTSSSPASTTPGLGTPPTGIGSTGAMSPLAGGGAMADFSTIMMLIEQTIEPESWLNAGGTSVQFPYPNGVYVDPRGHIRRLKDLGSIPAFASGISSRASFAKSGLRTISLKQLDTAIGQRLAMGLGLTRDMHELGGLARIQFVVIDSAKDDILLVGPKSGGAEGISGFTLDDLVTLARLVSDKTAPLGCSIDPTQEGLKKAAELLEQPATIHRLSHQPKSITEKLQTALGAHKINVFGLNPSTATAVALIDADEHMKRVGLGVAKTVPSVRSYFDHLDNQASVPSQSLIRWWFSFSDHPLNVSAAGDMFELPVNSVAVLSQQQWMDQQGTRQPTGKSDRAADAFAAEMTEKLPQIRKAHPAYARLNAIFELSLALQLAVEGSKQNSLSAWLPTVCTEPRLIPASVEHPQTIDGLATYNRMRNGTVVAVISGGIVVDVASTATQKERHITKSSVQISAPPTTSSSRVVWHD